MKLNKISVIIIALIVLVSISFAKNRDVLYMSDGSEHIGELVEIKEEVVVFETSDGFLELEPSEVRSIDLGTWRPGDDWKSRLDIDDEILLSALERVDEVSREYTSSGYITLYEKGELTFREDGTARLVRRYIYYIANESGKNKANWSTRYFKDAHDVNIDFARAIGLSKVSTVADNAIEDGSTNSLLSEYQRRRIRKFALTGASLGSVVDYQISREYLKLDIFNGLDLRWKFYDTEPKLVSIFEIAQKGEVPFEVKEFKIPKPKKSKRDGYSVKTYKMENIEPYVEENMLPNLDLIFPNIAITIPSDIAEFSGAYYAKVQEAFDAKDVIKDKLSAQFPKGSPTIEQVYNFVAENYTSNWVGMSDYYPYSKPLSQLLTFSRIARHELVFVLYCFLVEAGFDANLVLLGPGLDSSLPLDMLNIEHFHDLRVSIHEGEITRYLAPNEYLRYDHQYLSGLWILPIAENGAKLIEIPRVDGDYAYSIPEYECILYPDGALDVQYNIIYHGPTGGDSYRYHKNDKPRQLKNYFESLAKGIDGMANLVDFSLTGIKSLTEQVEVSYSVHIPGYAVSAGEEILAFKLPTVDYGSSQVGAATRTLPFSLPGDYYNEKLMSIKLPEGYIIEHLPSSMDLSNEYTGFSSLLSIENQTLEYKQVNTGTHAPIIQVKEYLDYKKFVESRARFSENWILIRKSN
ncbi:DUF3857 domain-containing protein [bacterium]|nr:DUF3857 domain-containing protein [bacterium]